MMRDIRQLCCVFGLLFGLLVATPAVVAQTDQNVAPLVFRDAGEEARFHALSSELRCVMCQNQSLADSNAIIARDLRVEVLALMRKGMSDDEIKSFLVQRYGEFVLYKPRMHGLNTVLWIGPLALMFGGAAALLFIVRKCRPANAVRPGNAPDEEQEW